MPERGMMPKLSFAAVTIVAAFCIEARVLPETLLLPQCEFYPLREQDRGYLYRYTDQPLLIDPDLPEDLPHPEFETRRHRFWGEWFSQADWNRAQEIAKDCGFDGFGFFPRPHRVRYWDAMEVSPVGNFLSVPIAHNYSDDGSDLSKWFGHAVKSTKGYRINGKALVLSYRFANKNPPERLKMKMERMRREFGDTFMFVCDISKILNPDEALANGRLSGATVEKYKELVRSYLRVCDGVIVGDGFSIMKFDRDERVFFPSHYRQIVRLMKETVDEPEFKGRKLLGLSAIVTHQNPTVEFWTANEDGLQTLTESLKIACEAEPDVILLPEWDEFNENTCVGPTLANGYSVKRVLRYFRHRLGKAELSPCKGDDTSVPNLIVSYRRNVSPGERLIVDVLNVPDGVRKGNLDVKVELLDLDGKTVFSGGPQRTGETELRHLRFPVDSASVSEMTRAATVRVIWRKDGASNAVEEGLHPISFLPAEGWCKKEVHQPLRDIAPVGAATRISLSNGRASASIKCSEPIRYAFLCGNGQIQHVAGDPQSACMRFREDASNAVFAVSGTSPAFIDRRKFEYRLDGVSSAEWLDWRGAHTGRVFKTDWLSKVGDPYYVRLPKDEVSQAFLDIDFGDVFKGRIPLAAAFREGAYALGGAKGVQFSATRFRRQSRYPSVAGGREISFDVAVDGDRPSMMYHVQVVTMGGKTWRSRPFVVEPQAESAEMTVKSAFDGTLRKVFLPRSRIPFVDYDFRAATGDFVPVADRHLHFATVLGGQYSIVTLWNRSSSGGTDAPIGAWPDWNNALRTAPARTCGPDGSVSLAFDGVDDFFVLPWETVPQNSGYRMTLELSPSDVGGRISLLSSKMLLNASVEQGVVHVAAPGVKKVSTGLKLEKDRWQCVSFVHYGDRFEVGIDGKTFSAPAKLPASFMSPVAFSAPLRGSGMKPFKGALRRLSVDHSCAVSQDEPPPPYPGIESWGFRYDLAQPEPLEPVPTNGVVFVRGKVAGRESYSIDVAPGGNTTITAEDDEGLRRAVYHYQDRVRAGDLKSCVRKPWVKNRISRCFFSPIKRPPLNRDELMDDVDYYPEAYLDRLAHEGVNGIWITVVWRDIAGTSFTKRSPNADRRIAKLRRTVARCLKYGIKTWMFCIEPKAVKAGDPLFREHPELFGSSVYADGSKLMCTAKPAARRYIEESVRDIFEKVPGLGGVLMIAHGERPTSCLSPIDCVVGTRGANCCRECLGLEPWQIYRNTSESIVRGIRAAGSGAEYISWFYQPQVRQQRAAWVAECARHVPDGVTFMYNFESGAVKEQLGRDRNGGDYWLSFVGPAEGFKTVSDAGRSSGACIGAKIQVGNSHEVATVPFVPVPGLLYRKYKAMKEAGVSSVLQCWYFGNYPGIMNKAAGELSFCDFSEDEETFLRKLAAPYWGKDAALVADVWKRLSDAYAEYPLSNNMQYYGPFHSGPAWPLHAEVRLLPLARTWKPLDPPSGDTVGEALENHTIEEAAVLAMRMARGSQMSDTSGHDILDVLAQRWKDHPERVKDIGVMRALQCQFASGCNIFRFYACRAKALHESRARKNPAAALSALEEMDRIVSEEEAVTRRLFALAKADSRLGFHSEAEAHQYHPAKLEWRLRGLKKTRSDVARIDSAIRSGGSYPESDFERNAPSCRAGGGWTDMPGGSRFRLKDEPNGDMTFEVLLRNRCPVRMNTIDAAGVSWYRSLLIEPNGTVKPVLARNRISPEHEVAVSSVESTFDGPVVKFTISSRAWGGSGERRPGWIQFEEKSRRPWPDVANRHIEPWRLNLGTLYADCFGRILR